MNKLIEKAMAVKGCVPAECLAFQLGYLEMLKNNGHLSNTLETGVFGGRTGIIPVELGAEHVGIDYTSLIDSREHFLVIKENSRFLPYSKVEHLFGKVDFMLIDGEHSYEAVYNDLTLASKLLSDTGILILDDTTLKFPGVINALSAFMRDNPQTFYRLCDSSFEVSLCRSHSWEKYYNYTLFELPKKMVEYLEDDSYRIRVYSGESDEQNNCFLNQPFIKMFFFSEFPKRLEYIGNEWFNDEPNTFPVISRQTLTHLNIE